MYMCVTLIYLFICFSFSNNCEQDAVIISIINGITSVYAATVIYTIIGFRAAKKFDNCLSKYVFLYINIHLNRSTVNIS